MIPVIGVVGWHRSGKTTFIVGLMHALQERGIQVATIKHTREAIDMDREGTDTWLFAQAGSQFVAIAGPDGSAVLYPPQREPSFWELVAMVPAGIQLIIVEGYRNISLPRFEILLEGYPQTPADLLLAAAYRDLQMVPADLPANLTVLQATDYTQAADLLLAKGICRVPS